MGKTFFVDLSGIDIGGLLNKVLYTALRCEVKPLNTPLSPGGRGVRKLWIFVFDAVTGSGSRGKFLMGTYSDKVCAKTFSLSLSPSPPTPPSPPHGTFFGSVEVSGKLPTYPSPKSQFCPK